MRCPQIRCSMFDVRCSMFPLVLLAFHKPFGVVSQFTPDGSRHRTLAEFVFPPRVYPLGRLDAESEGLLLLSDEAELNARLLHPKQGHHRVYWAQVERIPTADALAQLERGVTIGGTPHAALSRPTARSATHARTARSADSLSKERARCLDRARAGRREESSSASDDRDDRTSDAPPCARADRRT